MTLALLVFAVILLVSLIAGMVRAALGPTAIDRMLAAQLMGTTGVGMLLLLAYGLKLPALINVALTFALLAPIAAVAFAQWRGAAGNGADES